MYAPNGTLQFIGRFLEEQRLKDVLPMCLIYEDASRHDQLDYRLANLKLAGDGHCIPDYNDLLKDLVKQHLRDFKTENAAALQAQGFWDGTPCLPCWALLNTYWLAPTNDEATTLCLSKEDIYRLCLDRPVIAGRAQAQAADKKCLIFELLSTRPDNCTSWPTYKCASQKLAQMHIQSKFVEQDTQSAIYQNSCLLPTAPRPAPSFLQLCCPQVLGDFIGAVVLSKSITSLPHAD